MQHFLAGCWTAAGNLCYRLDIECAEPKPVVTMDNQFCQQASTTELLAQLRRLKVEIAVDGDRLVCSAPNGVLSPELQKLMTSRKPEILGILRSSQRGGKANGDLQPSVASYNLCVHESFERQVERTPDAIAVVCGSERLTYRELNIRSNRLANRLCALGVSTETVVAIYLDRSIDLVLAALGVL